MLKLGRPPRKFTTEEAADLYNSGMTFEQVAIALSKKYGESIPSGTIRLRLKDEGIKLNRQRPMTDYERLLKFKEKQKERKQKE